MHWEHLPQCGRALVISQVCVQLVDHSIMPPQPASVINLTTSPLVFHKKPLVTLSGRSLRTENRCSNPANTFGCVVRVALEPTTWREIGRFRLTIPFS